MKEMMNKRIAAIATLFASIVLLLFAAVLCVGVQTDSASAEDGDINSRYIFTLVTDEDGSDSYAIALKATKRNSLKTVVVPSEHNGLPVSRLANNAFMSCSKLTRVSLPTTVTAIGSNAFRNCAVLKTVLMPSVESIGASAFAMCRSLDRLYIPQSVKTVGANILQNNSNTVFIQTAADSLGDGWSSQWNSYHTGAEIFSAEPNAAVRYREIYDTSNTRVIGYEVCEYQSISSEDADLVIYDSFRAEGSSEYLPVLNICQTAFQYSTLRSLTVKRRSSDDITAPTFDHHINIRSKAFYCAYIDEIVIETGVAFDHPDGLQVGPTEDDIDAPITGDEDGHSIGVFEEVQMRSITLPSDMPIVCKNMFYNCNILSSIKIAGQQYDGKNILPNVTAIGEGAFHACGMLPNLYIPSTVTQMGSAAFDSWGTCEDGNYGYIDQHIVVPFFELLLPSDWSGDWLLGVNPQNVTVEYKTVTVSIALYDGAQPVSISVSHNKQMPQIQMPTRAGYDFRGVYSEASGGGLQYYTAEGASARAWQQGDPTALYAYWIGTLYTITFDNGGGAQTASVQARFGQAMPSASLPTRAGYEFEGYYFRRADGAETQYYDEYMCSTRDWDKSGAAVLHAKWSLINYKITYNPNGGSNPSSNPVEYTIETPTINFTAPTGKRGYKGAWNILSIPKGSTGNITVSAVWTIINYDIEYKNLLDGVNPSSNPTQYTVEDDTITFAPPTGRKGYTGSWDISSIPRGSTENKTITAIWTPIIYKISYYLNTEQPVTNNNPTLITCEDVVELTYATTGGAMFVGWLRNSEYVYTLSNITSDVHLTAEWSDGDRVSVKPTMKELIVYRDNMTLYMPGANFGTSGVRIMVVNGVNNLTVSSQFDIVYDMYIDCGAHNSSLTLLLKNVKIKSPSVERATVYKPSGTLNVKATGNCAVYGRNGADGAYHGASGVSGGDAFYCYDINILSVDVLTVNGGNGGYGYGNNTHGGRGGYAIYSFGDIEVYDDGVSLIGGNGGDARYNCTTAGIGSAATNYSVFHSSCDVTIVNGSNGAVK